MMKFTVCFLFWVLILLGMSTCSNEEVSSPAQVIDNMLAVSECTLSSRPSEVEIYIGHVEDGECNLAFRTYASVETLVSSNGKPLMVLDDDGNELKEGNYLLPPLTEVSDLPVSVPLPTKFCTRFRVRLEGQENDTYFFRVKLRQPGTGKEYITRKYALAPYKDESWGVTSWHLHCELFEEIPGSISALPFIRIP